MAGQEELLPQDDVRAVTPETVLSKVGSQTGTYLRPSSSGDRVSGGSKVGFEM